MIEMRHRIVISLTIPWNSFSLRSTSLRISSNGSVSMSVILRGCHNISDVSHSGRGRVNTRELDRGCQLIMWGEYSPSDTEYLCHNFVKFLSPESLLLVYWCASQTDWPPFSWAIAAMTALFCQHFANSIQLKLTFPGLFRCNFPSDCFCCDGLKSVSNCCVTIHFI